MLNKISITYRDKAEQYREIKQHYPDALLICRGAHSRAYANAYGNDALVIATAIGLTVQTTATGDSHVTIPPYAVAQWVQELINQGHPVAIAGRVKIYPNMCRAEGRTEGTHAWVKLSKPKSNSK